MERKKRVSAACVLASKTGKPVALSGIPVAAFRWIRAEVRSWSLVNPPWVCHVEKAAAELVVVPEIWDEKTAADDLRAVVDLATGGDLDNVARYFYDIATIRDVAIVDQPLAKQRAKAAVQAWNDQKLGDVVVRTWRGKLIFYRRQWLKGRNLDSALDVWRACQGLEQI